ncbi:protein S40-4-like [Vicia villosa]|uniref:protein S40-4-like n=1 Tax=Vicia villosa TaxID=3911 RepID=UPI00273ABA13|nr:protein S40-4-like [Vicia villosa]
MANNYFAKRNHHFLSVSTDRDSSLSLTTDSDSVFEFHESDIYNSNHDDCTEFGSSLHGSRSVKKSSSLKTKDAGGTPASVPVNIPDWSKILGDEYANSYMKRYGTEEEREDEDESGWVPPHEFLARKGVASLSVQEGVGRTLKGRDLSRLRNAIWAKTGFQ